MVPDRGLMVNSRKELTGGTVLSSDSDSLLASLGTLR